MSNRVKRTQRLCSFYFFSFKKEAYEMPIDLKGYKLILGSASKGRGEILDQAGIVYARITADVDEDHIGNRTTEEGIRALPLLLAQTKRDELLKRVEHGYGCKKLLVTTDIIGIHAGHIREKPKDADEFREWLEFYSACTQDMEFLNGMTVTNLETGVSTEGTHTCFITLKGITSQAIKEFLKQKEFYKCSGGIMHEHPLWVKHTQRIRGGEDSITGMPLGLLEELITKVFGEIPADMVQV